MGQTHSRKSKLEFAAELVAWRQKRGEELGLGRPISQSEAAKELGMSVRTLQNWEIARTRPSGVTLALLRRILES